MIMEDHKEAVIVTTPPEPQTLEKAFIETPVGQEPNEHEKATLRRVGDRLPMAVFLVAIIELCERFTYYGCQGVFQNYVANSPSGSDGSVGLGLEHTGATGLTTFYTFWCYVTPLLGGIVADQYLGKYKTLLASSGIYMAGLLVLVCTAIPSSLSHGAGLGGFITSILLTGIGTGGIKANVAPLIAEQYTRRHMEIAVTKKGDRVIIDPYITISHIYLMFYWCINVGSLSLCATPFMERYIGFWSAYLMCLCAFIVGTTVLVLSRSKYIDRPPNGSVITDAFRIIWVMMRHRSTDAPKVSWQAARGLNEKSHWQDHFVDEVKRCLVACKVFLIFPIFWLCYGQFSNNFVSQAGQMSLHGIPNDFMQNFDPISIIVLVPIMDQIVYPVLLKFRILLRPITRICLGFFAVSLAMMWAAITQHLIYSAGPCYDRPQCQASYYDGEYHGNNVHIAVQTPSYVLIGIGEIFASATGYEYAYTKAPPHLKSFVQSLFLLTTAVGSALNEAFVALVVDPKVLWMYTGFAVTSFIAAIVIYVLFHGLDDKEEDLNYIEGDVTPTKEQTEQADETAEIRSEKAKD